MFGHPPPARLIKAKAEPTF